MNKHMLEVILDVVFTLAVPIIFVAITLVFIGTMKSICGVVSHKNQIKSSIEIINKATNKFIKTQMKNLEDYANEK